jgi:hypothetical protein
MIVLFYSTANYTFLTFSSTKWGKNQGNIHDSGRGCLGFPLVLSLMAQ